MSQYEPPGGSGSVTPPTFACPKCGHSVPVGTPICGNCGAILQGGGPHVPEPLAARGIRPGAVITFAVSLALAIAGFLGRGAIGDAFDSLTDAVEDSTNPGIGGGQDIEIPDIDVPDIDTGEVGGPRTKGARNIGQIVREIRAAGIPCANMDVQSADDYVASGSCLSNGQHVQINIYFRQVTMDFARDFYSDWAFATAHRDNWWISGDTELMRRIANALDARFRPPS